MAKRYVQSDVSNAVSRMVQRLKTDPTDANTCAAIERDEAIRTILEIYRQRSAQVAEGAQ